MNPFATIFTTARWGCRGEVSFLTVVYFYKSSKFATNMHQSVAISLRLVATLLYFVWTVAFFKYNCDKSLATRRCSSIFRADFWTRIQLLDWVCFKSSAICNRSKILLQNLAYVFVSVLTVVNCHLILIRCFEFIWERRYFDFIVSSIEKVIVNLVVWLSFRENRFFTSEKRGSSSIGSLFPLPMILWALYKSVRFRCSSLTRFSRVLGK